MAFEKINYEKFDVLGHKQVNAIQDELINHTHTADEVGAAPAGYVAEKGTYENYAALVEKIQSVFASMPVNTKKTLFADVLNGDIWSGEFPRGSYFVEIYKEWNTYGYVKFSSNAYQIRAKSSSLEAFMYENPPMYSGVEFRTTEQYNGKSVYKKKVDGVIQYRLDGETAWKDYADALGCTRIQTGSYVGTGTAGVGNPNKLTFNFVPKLVLVYGAKTSAHNADLVWFCHGQSASFGHTTRGLGELCNLTWSSTTLSWYSASDVPDSAQGNVNGRTYTWVAFG